MTSLVKPASPLVVNSPKRESQPGTSMPNDVIFNQEKASKNPGSNGRLSVELRSLNSIKHTFHKNNKKAHMNALNVFSYNMVMKNSEGQTKNGLSFHLQHQREGPNMCQNKKIKGLDRFFGLRLISTFLLLLGAFISWYNNLIAILGTRHYFFINCNSHASIYQLTFLFLSVLLFHRTDRADWLSKSLPLFSFKISMASSLPHADLLESEKLFITNLLGIIFTLQSLVTVNKTFIFL